MKHLISLLIRIASGERLRKATDEDYRHWFGFFFFFGALMVVMFAFADRFLRRPDTFILWLGATALLSIMAFGLILWSRYVPASVSLILGIATWGVFVWAFIL